jgi:hypothetical protein
MDNAGFQTRGRQVPEQQNAPRRIGGPFQNGDADSLADQGPSPRGLLTGLFLNRLGTNGPFEL